MFVAINIITAGRMKWLHDILTILERAMSVRHCSCVDGAVRIFVHITRGSRSTVGIVKVAILRVFV